MASNKFLTGDEIAKYVQVFELPLEEIPLVHQVSIARWFTSVPDKYDEWFKPPFSWALDACACCGANYDTESVRAAIQRVLDDAAQMLRDGDAVAARKVVNRVFNTSRIVSEDPSDGDWKYDVRALPTFANLLVERMRETAFFKETALASLQRTTDELVRQGLSADAIRETLHQIVRA